MTTTEVFEKYSDESLLRLGDWVFPNAHPYFHSQLDAEAAVRGTRAAYEDLAGRSDRPVILKEVGLPTALGNLQGGSDAEGVRAVAYRQDALTACEF